MPNDLRRPFISSGPTHVVQYSNQERQQRFTTILNSMNQGSNAALMHMATPLPEILLQAVIIPGENTNEGTLVEAVAFPLFEILDLIEKDPDAMYRLHWRKFEEIIAGAYHQQGFKVTLTPRSNDGGYDVIAERNDFGAIRFFDQVKLYKPGHVVTLEEVHAMIGVLSTHPNVSKGIVTTTSTFAPRLEEAAGIKDLLPTRLELRDRTNLLAWWAAVRKK